MALILRIRHDNGLTRDLGVFIHHSYLTACTVELKDHVPGTVIIMVAQTQILDDQSLTVFDVDLIVSPSEDH